VNIGTVTHIQEYNYPFLYLMVKGNQTEPFAVCATPLTPNLPFKSKNIYLNSCKSNTIAERNYSYSENKFWLLKSASDGLVPFIGLRCDEGDLYKLADSS